MDDTLQQARALLITALGRQSAFWGVGKVAGQLFATLYLAQRPLSLEEVAASLQVTKGSVSVSVRSLEQLGMVRRSYRPGDRRVFFEAEADFWKVAAQVLQRRQRPAFDESFTMVSESLAMLRRQDGAEARAMEERVAALKAFYDELDEIAAALLVLGPRGLHRLARMARLVRRLHPHRT